MFLKGIGALILGLYIGLNAEYSEIKPADERKYCTIVSEDSNLLYKNQYEENVLFYENTIFLDEKSGNNTIPSMPMEINMMTGSFDREFINVKYGKDTLLYTDYLSYIEGSSVNGTINKKIIKGFDKNGKEIDITKNAYITGRLKEKKKFYSLIDVTSRKGENYIVGFYVESFEDDNPNFLTILTVFRKENIQIDVSDERQVEKFWEQYADYEIDILEPVEKKSYIPVETRGKTYYCKLTSDTWKGEYHQEQYYTGMPNSIQEVVSYEKYLEYLENISNYTEEKICPYYNDKNLNYIILGSSGHKFELLDCVEKNGDVVIYGDESFDSKGNGFFVAIPTKQPIGTQVTFMQCHSPYKIKNLIRYGNMSGSIEVYKPIIYLYPTGETEVNVKLMNSELLTCVYPEYDYENGWNVTAKSNGNLIDTNTGRSLYSLYYENKAGYNFKVENDGFIVKGEDIASFLEEKLAILGLTEREANEFIIYWLPVLQENKYNYIRFATEAEINQNMPLNITPTPDTTVRVLMTYKGLEEPIEVEEQILVTPERNGFVAVEWGGTELR